MASCKPRHPSPNGNQSYRTKPGSIEEVLSLRYTPDISLSTYQSYLAVVPTAKWLYEHMLSSEGGPKFCTVRALDKVTGAQLPSQPISIKQIKSYLNNNYLNW